MKRFTSLLAAVLLIMLTTISCSDNSKDTKSESGQNDASYTYVNDDALPNGTPGLARKIIEEDLYIDLDTAALNETMQFIGMCNMKIAAGDTTATQVPDRINDNIAKAKATTYRYMTKLKVVDNRLVLDPSCTAESLKIHPEIFEKILEDIENTNEYFAIQAAAGNEDIQMPDIDIKELDHILD